MRLNLLLPLCLLSGAFALPVRRAAPPEPVVETAIAAVGRTLEKLDAVLGNTSLWLSDARRATSEALSLTKEVSFKLRTGRKDILRGPTIPGNESMKLVNWSSALTKYFTSTSQAWIRHKNQVVSAADVVGSCSVLDTLIVLSHDTANFNDAISTKMVSVAGVVGDRLFKAPQTSEIDRTIKEYER
jgi:hypothetical protein